MIIYWNKVNSFNHENLYNPSCNQITLFVAVDMFPGKIFDISYSTFLEQYISNNNNKKSMNWVVIGRWNGDVFGNGSVPQKIWLHYKNFSTQEPA